MIRSACAMALCGVLPALPAAAQSVNCSAAQTQVEMTFCAEQDFKAADADLNAAYRAARALMRRIDADLPADQRGAERHLRDGQRAWITFRDNACAAEGYTFHGGSGEPMVIYGCDARLTRQRSADLWALAKTY